MSPNALIAVVGGLGLGLAACAMKVPEAEVVQGSGGKAPVFSAKTADGKTLSLSESLRGGPVYLYFIKSDCPINLQAIGHYKNVGQSYGSKAPLIGVFNGDAAEFKSYQARHKLPFTVVLDPQHRIINAYKAERSPWVIEVKQNGTIGKVWEGFSRDYLNELSSSVAVAMKVQPKKLDFSTAPSDPRYG